MVFAAVVSLSVGAPLAAAAGPVTGRADMRAGLAPTAAGTYAALKSSRVLDTRAGVGAPAAPVAAAGTLLLSVLGRGGVPAAGVAAVVLNVTVTQSTSSGFLTAYAAGDTRPVTSSLNHRAAVTVAARTIVGVGVGGQVALYNGSAGTVQLVADVSGYYVAGAATVAGAFTSVPPARVLDTRHTSAVGGGGTVSVTVAGVAGVPVSGVSAVAATITVTQPSDNGYLVAHPDSGSVPATSTLDFRAGDTVADLDVVSAGPDGRIAITNRSTGAAQVLVDVLGYYLSGAPSAGGSVVPLTPVRILDTRNGTGVAKGAIAAHHPFGVAFPYGAGIPSSNLSAVIVNITATAATRAGYLTAYPTRSTRPATSDLNIAPGAAVANLAFVPVGSDGRIALYNGSAGTVQLIADVVGYVLEPRPAVQAVPENSAVQPGAVSCAGPSFCVALLHPPANGEEDTAPQIPATWSAYRGSSWSAPAALPTLQGAYAISCVSSTFCVATDGTTSIEFDGASWTAAAQLPPPFTVSSQYRSQTSISCSSSTFCLLTEPNADQVAARYDGTSWTATTALPPATRTADNLADLSCAGSVCTAYAVPDGSSATTEIVRYDGTSWSDLPSVPFPITALSCAAGFCLAVGSVDTSQPEAFVTFDGTSWSRPVTMHGDIFRVSDLSCVSATWCMASIVTQLQTSSYAVFDGSRFATPQPFTGAGQLSCATATLCASAGADGGLWTWTGSWSTAPALPGTPRAVSCASPMSCLAVDDNAHAQAWDGAGWNAEPAAAGMSDLETVSCVSSSFCIAGGLTGDGRAAAVLWTGTTWAPATTLTPIRSVVAISCASPTFCVALGGTQPVQGGDGAPNYVEWSRFDGSSWSPAQALGHGQQDPDAVSCTSATFCAATVGSPAAVNTFDGADWTPFLSAAAGGPVSCAPDTTTCVAGTALLHTGTATTWTSNYGVYAYDTTTDVSCPRNTFCMAADLEDGLHAALWNGSWWSANITVDADFPPDVGAVSRLSCATPTFCAAIGIVYFDD